MHLPKRVLVLALLAAAPVAAQTADVPRQAEERLRAIYDEGAFAVETYAADWLADGSGYARLEAAGDGAGTAAGEAADGEDVRELVRYAVPGGERTVVVSGAELVPAGATGPVDVVDFAFAPDGSAVLLEANLRDDPGARVAELWLFDLEGRTLRKVAEAVEPGGVSRAFSPDGGRILFERDHDLWVTDAAGARTVALTTTGAVDTLYNERAAWSPDGERVLFVERDVSEVPLRAVLDPVDPSYPEVRFDRFARVGTTIPSLRVGVAPAGGGDIRWLPIPQPEEGFYLGEVSWAGTGEVVVEHRNRPRDARAYLLLDADGGGVERMYEETDPAWVVASYRLNAGLEWVDGGRQWVLVSEKDGWRHAYLYGRGGREIALLTPGDYDVIERGPVVEGAEDGDWLYFYASPDDATQRYLYRVALDGSGAPERVTPGGEPGWHDYRISPDGRWALQTRSSFEHPPVTALVSLPDHRTVRVLEDNAAVAERAAPLLERPADFIEIDIGDGVVMDAWMMKPRDFDPERRYPLFVYVYGEPHAQTVMDRWTNNRLYHQTLADLGYVVVSIDNRGTPAPKGAAWRRASFPTLGTLSTEEQAAGVQELERTYPFLNGSVGTWGWSGGGSNTLNAMFRRPDVFDVGIAVVPKPQPWLYNAWFQEIYMGTVEANPEGYRVSAPINYAEGLEGDLMIIHGTGETNTHLEIVEGLVDRLVALEKTFDYMTYPNRNHGLSEGEGTPLHVRMLMARYLLEHLQPGPR